MQDELYWIWLQMIFGFGKERIKPILEHFLYDAQNIFDTPYSQLQSSGQFLKADLIKLAQKEQYMSDAKLLQQRCKQVGCRVLTPSHLEYPQCLRNIPSPPLALYVLGDMRDVDNTMSFGIIGARNDYTEYGNWAADKFSRDLATCGFTIVSGLARGIDSIAHKGALKVEGHTIAVLGNGIDSVYPAEHRLLKSTILKAGGAVVSEYPPDYGSAPQCFPARNRIISALSKGILVVEARQQSGTSSTVAHAYTQGKDIFALPGDARSPVSKGTNFLIKKSMAAMVTCSRDILDAYRERLEGITFKTHEGVAVDIFALMDRIEQEDYYHNSNEIVTIAGRKSKQSATTPDGLSESQKKVFKALDSAPVHIDILVGKAGLPINEVLGAITLLEALGTIRALPGRMYSL